MQYYSIDEWLPNKGGGTDCSTYSLAIVFIFLFCTSNQNHNCEGLNSLFNPQILCKNSLQISRAWPPLVYVVLLFLFSPNLAQSPKTNLGLAHTKRIQSEATLFYQSQVSILGPVGYGPTTLPLRHSDCWLNSGKYNIYLISNGALAA